MKHTDIVLLVNVITKIRYHKYIIIYTIISMKNVTTK